MELFDLVGLAGAAFILLAYAGVQFKRLDPHRFAALCMNFVGAALVLVSLRYKFNLAAALLEGAWALIALQGLIRLGLGRGGSAD
jgi:hypothetical protein